MTKPKKPKSRVIAIVIILFGLLFTTIGGGITIYSYSFSKTAISTSGVVTNVEVNWSNNSSGSSSSPTYQPTISFYDQNGVKQRAQTFLSSSSYNYAIGTKLRILYDPENTSNMRIDSWFAVWGFGLIFLVTGVIIMIVGFFVKNATKARQPKTVSITDETLAARSAADAKKADYSYSSTEKTDKHAPTVRRR